MLHLLLHLYHETYIVRVVRVYMEMIRDCYEYAETYRR